jgi:hypothetical protein
MSNIEPIVRAERASTPPNAEQAPSLPLTKKGEVLDTFEATTGACKRYKDDGSTPASFKAYDRSASVKFSTAYVDSRIMPQYRYCRLPPVSIRLLRLLPSERDVRSLQGELFEYRLRSSDTSSHPYEALSYVWGDEEKPQSISIGSLNLDITRNLYNALLYLRNHDCSRVLWVDAVCINQEDDKEKEDQIPFMAEIYAKATRVVIWLGVGDKNGDLALDAIRFAGKWSTEFSDTRLSHQAIPELLRRKWFQRVWVREQSSKFLIETTK